MKNYLYLFLIGMLALLPFAMADTSCSTADGTSTANYYLVLKSAYRGINASTENQSIVLINSITPLANFTQQFNETVAPVAVGGYVTLGLYGIDNSTAAVYNSSGGLVTADNYSITNLTPGPNSSWIISVTGSEINGTNVTVSYNRSFVVGTDNIYGTGAYGICGTGCAIVSLNTSYGTNGATVGWRITNSTLKQNLTGNNWTTTWAYRNTTCVPGMLSTTCAQAKGIVYAAFALISLLSLVAAAFLLINMFKGGSGEGAMATTLTIIGLGVVIMVGFIVIYFVGASWC